MQSFIFSESTPTQSINKTKLPPLIFWLSEPLYYVEVKNRRWIKEQESYNEEQRNAFQKSSTIRKLMILRYEE